MPRCSGAMALVEALLAHGVETMFGLPGGQLDHLFDALYQQRSRIRLIPSRHEQGAAYMAYGYARSTGRTGVYAVVPGPGVLNTTAALCTAYACNAPVLCLAGQIPSGSIGKGFGELHELPDQLATLQTLTQWAARIESPAAAPERVAEAFFRLRSGRPRPVALEMAPDVMAREDDIQQLSPRTIKARASVPAQIEQAAELLVRARMPMIYVGGGALEAAPAIRQLAELLSAPVVSFRAGRGVMPDAHRLGLTLPMGHRIWPQVDVVLGIGSRMLDPLRNWGTDADLKVIRIDVDEEEIQRLGRPEVGLCCDAACALTALVPEVERRLTQRVDRREQVAQIKTAVATEIGAVQPQLQYLRAIRDVMPEEGFFCDEITQCGFASWYGYPVSRPREHINCGYQGTLGYGYATALGVKVANPDAPVVSIAGDGGMMFNLSELATAVQYQIGVKTVLFNSGSYTNVQRQQREWFGNRLIASELRNPDFKTLAESFGVAAHRAHTPEELRKVLERELAQSGPALIEVPVGDMSSPWPLLLLPRNRGDTAAARVSR